MIYATGIMEKKTQTIPWDRIEPHMTGHRNQPWLAGQLGVTKAAVTNWKGRGGIPLEHAPRISALFEIPLEDLMGVLDDGKSPNRGHNRPLSDIAQEAIRCIVRLDAFDGSSRDLLKHHLALMEIAEEAFSVQHSPHGVNVVEVEKLLGARIIETEGNNGHRGWAKGRKAG